MTLKIIIFLAIVVGAFLLFRGSRGRVRGRSEPRVEQLEACPKCGAFRKRGDLCACENAPTP